MYIQFDICRCDSRFRVLKILVDCYTKPHQSMTWCQYMDESYFKIWHEWNIWERPSEQAIDWSKSTPCWPDKRSMRRFVICRIESRKKQNSQHNYLLYVPYCNANANNFTAYFRLELEIERREKTERERPGLRWSVWRR